MCTNTSRAIKVGAKRQREGGNQGLFSEDVFMLRFWLNNDLGIRISAGVNLGHYINTPFLRELGQQYAARQLRNVKRFLL